MTNTVAAYILLFIRVLLPCFQYFHQIKMIKFMAHDQSRYRRRSQNNRRRQGICDQLYYQRHAEKIGLQRHGNIGAKCLADKKTQRNGR